MLNQVANERMIRLINHKVCLRPPSDTEMETVRVWRNQDRVRKQFFNEDVISQEAQQIWWSSQKLLQADHHFMILTRDKRPVGFASLYNRDVESGRIEIGRLMIGNDSDLNKGYMTSALTLLIDYAKTALGLSCVYLNVKETNIAGIRCYTRVGFRTISQDNGIVTMEI